MRLAIGLSLRNQQDLDILLEQLYNPTSPTYHRYLTTAQFTDAFGPTAKDQQAVIDFVQSNGLRVVGTFPNRLVLDVAGSVTNIERTFHVRILQYQHPTQPRMFHAPNVDPTVPTNLAVVDITGLDDYCQAHPNHGSIPIVDSGAVANGGSGPGGTYTAADIRQAYASGVTLNGSGQTVGILSFNLFNASDVVAYEDANNISHVSVVPVLLDGYDGVTPCPDDGWQQEVDADIELCIGMAPGLAQVVVFEGNWANQLPNHVLNAMVNYSPRINQFSSSWGWGEARMLPQIAFSFKWPRRGSRFSRPLEITAPIGRAILETQVTTRLTIQTTQLRRRTILT